MTRLRYLGWEGYAEGAFAAALHRSTAIEISGENHLSDDLARRKLEANPKAWDIININTPFVRDCLHPCGFIKPVKGELAALVREIGGPFARFVSAAVSHEGQVIGIPQRCGPFNLVINRRRIACEAARKQGFSLALEQSFKNRFGILAYEDFNVIHIAIAAGLNPFEPFDDFAFQVFSDTARTILSAARMITSDHHALNRALINGDIDFYISGGVYTASPARLAGRLEVTAVTPGYGPINGKGGIAFVEINALLASTNFQDTGHQFLKFIESDDGALAASLAADACNPVAQMHRSSVFKRFTRDQLMAMQWDDFEHDIERCADYAIVPDYEKLLKILRSNAPHTPS